MGNTLITPMSPITYDHIFDSPAYIYQVKWDGVRMISYIDGGNVTLINKRLNYRTKQYPELSILPKLLKGNRAVIDGEIIALHNSKPSFPTVMRRDGISNTDNIQLLVKKIPVIYMVFDILFFEGEDLRNSAWEIRNNILFDKVKAAENIALVESFPEGTSLFKAVKSQQLEGVIAKQKESPYVSGKKHQYWLKIKYRRRLSCVIGGFTLRNHIINALLVGVYDNEQLLYCGRVGTGLKAPEWITLTDELMKLATTKSPFSELRPADYKNAHFVEPLVTLEVDFAEWTLGMHLRAPSIIGFSLKNPEECILT